MLLGIQFGNYHTSIDFSLILTSKEIGVPDVKENRVSIPAADGSIDLTEFYGGIKYGDRTHKFKFTKIGGDFVSIFSDIQNKLHGKRMNIILDNDPDFYYIGRVFVDSWEANAVTGELNIKCTCDPYKLKATLTTIDEIIGAGGSIELTCTNLRKSVIPSITVSGAVNISFGSSSYSVQAGTHKLTGIVFTQGENILTITGSPGTDILVEYREGGI